MAELDKYEIGNRLRFRPAFLFQLVSSPFLEYLLIATLGINSNDNKSSKMGPAMFSKAMSVNVVVPLVQIRLKKILNFFKFVSVTKLTVVIKY